MQLDFQKDFNAAAHDRSWISSEKAPTGWDVRFFPPAGQNILATPFGQPPYDDVEQRTIPLLREDILVPEKVSSVGTGACKGDYLNAENMNWHFIDNEFAGVKKWDSKPSLKSKKTDSALEIEIPAAGNGKFTAVTVDLGKITVGTLNVEVDGAQGSEVLDFHYFQCLRNGIPEYLPPGGGCIIALASRMRPAKGKSSNEFFHVMGSQHVLIIARDLTKKIKIKVNWRLHYYPFTMKGSFKSSDETLNRIYEACRHTQQICSLDSYVDTPWREQAQWWGDARVQAKNTFYIDGDARLFARGIRSIAGQDAPQGLTYGHAPTTSGWCILPDFSLTWIMTVWDYYWQTGDITVFKEQQKRIEAVLGYFETPEARDKSGLLVYDKRFWLFEDWSTLPKDRIPAFLNLWHLVTLIHYAKMLEISKQTAAAKKVADEIKKRKALLTKHFFDKKSGLMKAGFTADGKVSSEPSVHDQTLALLAEICTESTDKMVKKRMLPYLKQEKLDAPVPSAFWATYVFECMGELGYGKEVIDFIKTKWSPMLSTGTSWEGYEWNEKAGGSCSHAWTAHPTFHFVNIIAGVRQTAAGWKSISYTPSFLESLDFAEAVVPTPLGEISTSWKKSGKNVYATIKIPEAMSIEVILPGLKKKFKSGGTYEFNVSLK